MALHRLTSVTIAVPNVAATAAYYAELGLSALGGERFATVDGGEQLRLTTAPRRHLQEFGVGVDDADDLDRIAAALTKLGIAAERGPRSLAAVDPGTRVRTVISIAERIAQPTAPASLANGPGRDERRTLRADAVLRDGPVRPRKLGHVVVGSTDLETSHRFFIEGLGFKISDSITGFAAFLRCSTDHHNLLVQAAPVPLLHHTSWQVNDVDEIGRGAKAMLTADPSRHVWGLGRHYVGSNFFWYLRDPAGNFTEYYADLDCIIDDQLWNPGVWEGEAALYAWGPPPPRSFLSPDDLAELMAGTHGS